MLVLLTCRIANTQQVHSTATKHFGVRRCTRVRCMYTHTGGLRQVRGEGEGQVPRPRAAAGAECAAAQRRRALGCHRSVHDGAAADDQVSVPLRRRNQPGSER